MTTQKEVVKWILAGIENIRYQHQGFDPDYLSTLDNEKLFWLTQPSDWWFENTDLLFQFIHPKQHARLRYDLAYLMDFRDRHKVASEIFYQKLETDFFEFDEAYYSPDKNKIRKYFDQ